MPSPPDSSVYECGYFSCSVLSIFPRVMFKVFECHVVVKLFVNTFYSAYLNRFIHTNLMGHCLESCLLVPLLRSTKIGPNKDASSGNLFDVLNLLIFRIGILS